MKYPKTDVEGAIERLRKWYPKGSTVYTILRSVSRTGMSRTIGLLSLACDSDGEVNDLHPNWAVSRALGLPLVSSTWDGVKIGGAGMDMGFEIAYRLGHVLHGDGYALKHRWL